MQVLRLSLVRFGNRQLPRGPSLSAQELELAEDLELHTPRVVMAELAVDCLPAVPADRAPDFILVSGDLAFASEAEEYVMAAKWLDAVRAASGVPCDRIYCTSGNHNVRAIEKEAEELLDDLLKGVVK